MLFLQSCSNAERGSAAHRSTSRLCRWRTCSRASSAWLMPTVRPCQGTYISHTGLVAKWQGSLHRGHGDWSWYSRHAARGHALSGAQLHESSDNLDVLVWQPQSSKGTTLAGNSWSRPKRWGWRQQFLGCLPLLIGPWQSRKQTPISQLLKLDHHTGT